MKVLLATDKPFAAVAVKGIRQAVEESGMELVLLEKYTAKSQLLEAVAGVQAMIIRSDIVDAEVISSAKDLKIVVRAGAGYDNIDLDAATSRGICVMNTPGQNANAVAELVFGMLIYAVRGFFSGKSGTELKGKTLGLFAYGNVARNVARIAEGFNMKVSAYDEYLSAVEINNNGATATATKEDLFASSQIISLHIPATAETSKCVNYDLMARMPKGAILVNTARKEIINEPDLARMFADRPDFFYISDILPSIDAELKAAYPDRYLAMPKKLGAQTSEANINAGIAAAKQIVDFIHNGNRTFQVN
ncbi:MAG: 3-phosphoglycerate dehydrogenase [Tannerellaceae bacterium]|jgi:D-3-phosphoglycerate dehydrogenase|nr:3-phosphoglycerate dehydrogenase [Tannerellaceae bacterium]